MTVLCAGEALLDLVWDPPGVPARQASGLKLLTGGSPANVAVGLARLGTRARLCTTLGDDDLGAWLRHNVKQEGVDVSGVAMLPGRRSGLVFIHVDAKAERHFTPAREATADHALAPEHLPAALMRGVNLVLYSSGPLRTAEGSAFVSTLRARADTQGAWLTLDANLRPRMWKSVAENARAVLAAAEGAHILKCNHDEAHALTRRRDPEDALRFLRRRARAAAIITLGPRGALALGDGGVVHVPSPRVKVVDTTGAGDAFMAGVLAVLARHRRSDDETLRAALRLGARLGSLACTRVGATPALPRPADPAAYIRRHARL